MTTRTISNLSSELTNILLILRLSEIENYLLEPIALLEELRIYPTKPSFNITDSISMEKGLLELCDKLTTIVAANLLLHKESTREKYFTSSYNIVHNNREDIIQQTAKRLNWEFAKTEQRITEQENLIESKLDSLDNAYKIIDGKRLLNQIMLEYTSESKTAKRLEHLRKLLTRRIKEEIHEDILFIIQRRILL